MPFVGKDEQLCALDGEEAHVPQSHSFELSRSISGHGFESITKSNSLVTNNARIEYRHTEKAVAVPE